ncbi:MAG: sulfurtransferase [Betaproteobacteria bacterium]|nr:MAG: sulfurtransferase [Betaproteobacteria bacterium]
MAFTTLITVDELAANLDNPQFVIFDCRHELTNPDYGDAEYAKSHLPNAHFASVDRDLSARPDGTNGRHPLPQAETFAAWLGSKGVTDGVQVVGYDNAAGVYGSRLWWMLRWLGHDAVAVLDGGWNAWLKADKPTTQDIPQAKPATFTPRIRDVNVNAEYVLANLESDRMLVVDARSNDRFHGQNETIDPVAGHIPGAVNRLFKNNVNENGQFRPGEELRRELETLIGDTPVQNVVHQCGSGVSACHNLLAMELAGMSGSRLYPGSWSEWIADPKRPVATD